MKGEECLDVLRGKPGGRKERRKVDKNKERERREEEKVS
ncbi:hypothetical protein FKM95_000037 [Candidatus Tremblaya phenacola]|nr:hypothetical protein FKM95_000125 [Candidatus Tremblaya phenacola]KAH0998308.1 hypothetical protein FKM95_000037 [Candidatus Tremblaya phenacola]